MYPHCREGLDVPHCREGLGVATLHTWMGLLAYECLEKCTSHWVWTTYVHQPVYDTVCLLCDVRVY